MGCFIAVLENKIKSLSIFACFRVVLTHFSCFSYTAPKAPMDGHHQENLQKNAYRFVSENAAERYEVDPGSWIEAYLVGYQKNTSRVGSEYAVRG